jgi:hypothetical protein
LFTPGSIPDWYNPTIQGNAVCGSGREIPFDAMRMAMGEELKKGLDTWHSVIVNYHSEFSSLELTNRNWNMPAN